MSHDWKSVLLFLLFLDVVLVALIVIKERRREREHLRLEAVRDVMES